MTALLVAAPLIPSEAAPAGLGVSLVMAWLIVLAGVLLAKLTQPRFELCWGPTDLALWGFVVLHSLSAVVMSHHGQPRQTLNMLWQWVSFAACFFLVRQLVRRPAERRALVAVMIALAVGLSALGYYQYFYSNPASRRAYEADKEQLLKQAGLVAPAGSIERQQFENRLYSSEPLATFTLANSLAGFLAPWLLVAGGIAAAHGSDRPRPHRIILTSLACLCWIAGVVVLTKSRSSWLALLVGFGLMIVYGRRSGWRPGVKLISVVALSVIALVAGAIVVGSLDLLVITESSKSLLYRVQYWHASTQLIRDHPWFGCGPGNFQQYYTAYKLPGASETIADPHNFLVEIWATAGTPAFVSFVAIFACFVWQVRRGSNECADGRENTSVQDANRSDGVPAIYLGALAGLPLGFGLCLVVQYVPDFTLIFVSLPLAAIVLSCLHRWVRDGHMPTLALLVAAVVLLVHLLAAGGISFAGVSLTLWLLLALVLNTWISESRVQVLSRRLAYTVVGAAVGLAGLCWYSTYKPVVDFSAQVARAEQLQSESQIEAAEAAWLAATTMDTYDDRAWRSLANLWLARWLQGHSSRHKSLFTQAADQTLIQNPRSSSAYHEYGDWYLQAFRATGEIKHLSQSLAAYRRATELYPNYNFGHAQMAWTLHLAGENEASASEAAIALQLDELNPHREQKLVQRYVFDPHPPRDPSRPDPTTMNAEQLMIYLRSSQSDAAAFDAATDQSRVP